MTDILLSIHPRHANNIIAGSKKYEFRRTIPTREFENVWLYVTAPVGAIAGYFESEGQVLGKPHAVWESCKDAAGITEKEFYDYFNGLEIAHAIKVGNFFARPFVTIKDLMGGTDRPPQSFCYIGRDV